MTRIATPTRRTEPLPDHDGRRLAQCEAAAAVIGRGPTTAPELGGVTDPATAHRPAGDHGPLGRRAGGCLAGCGAAGHRPAGAGQRPHARELPRRRNRVSIAACIAPGLVEAVIPREDEHHGSTEEVPRRAPGRATRMAVAARLDPATTPGAFGRVASSSGSIRRRCGHGSGRLRSTRATGPGPRPAQTGVERRADLPHAHRGGHPDRAEHLRRLQDPPALEADDSGHGAVGPDSP